MRLQVHWKPYEIRMLIVIRLPPHGASVSVVADVDAALHADVTKDVVVHGDRSGVAHQMDNRIETTAGRSC